MAYNQRVAAIVASVCLVHAFLQLAQPVAAGTVELADGSLYTDTTPLSGSHMWNVSCEFEHYQPRMEGCHPTACARRVMDDLVTPEQLQTLLSIARRGMAPAADGGGPTILDVNSGYMKDTEGLKRIYPHIKFTAEEYQTYADVFDQIRDAIMETFGLERLWFTAPTFITRLIGNEVWEPEAEHDMYWTKHVDGINTEHYDYSGLLYLSTYGEDFGEKEGGRFVFYDDGTNHTIEPRAGRFLTFTAGPENLHQVRRVYSGERYTMSMWFTCDPQKEFSTFLDGKVHSTFKQQKQPPKRRRRSDADL